MTSVMDQGYFVHSRQIWKPKQPQLTSVEVFRRNINRKHGLKLASYFDLHKYSVEDYAFWLDLWEYLAIVSSVPPDPSRIVELKNLPDVPNWFPGARLNYAENLLTRRDDGIALTEAGENGILTHFSYRNLHARVQEISASLRANGLQVGDRVAAIITNSFNAIAIALAVASVGGIFSSTATDMGTQGILDRYKQIQPKFIFAEVETFYGGKRVDLLSKVKEVILDLEKRGLKQTILLPSRLSGKEIHLGGVRNTFLSTLRSSSYTALGLQGNPNVLFTPRGTYLETQGVLLQSKKEIVLALGAGRDDTYFQYTTTGWMMWNFMLSGLSVGCRIVLYEGSPFYPDVKAYLRFIHDQGVSILGTSPRFLAEVQGRGIDPLGLGSFESLKVLGSTGAVLTPPMFEWTQKAFGGKLHLVSTSGGTDVSTAFVTGVPSLPVYAGEIQAKALGMKVEVWDPTGNNLERSGHPGELGDQGGQKFTDAYFSMYPGAWRQGDFMVVNPKTNGIMILGRSDGVLNPSGIRFGSAEIYSVLEAFANHIDDSLCVGQRRPSDNDEKVLLFLKMRAGCTFTPELVENIRAAIKKSLSVRHVPAHIFEVAEIPYTVNGKKIEIAVKQIVSGSNLQPSGTVANPDSLQLYYKYRDLERVIGAQRSKL
ncbi:acetoacetyl-CoA synthetase [Coprinopsis sp. MPI-PUGE-AT-0042]|nr:acetoacetyl-CoA synthetase [Coprinopsis sp. MPI-PUGE-AT-0042]